MADFSNSATQERPSLHAELQVALNLIPAHTWYFNPSGALKFVNKRGADYLGLAKNHPLRFGIDNGATWDSHFFCLHVDDQEEARTVWSTCLSTGCAGQLSFRVRNAAGEYRWFLSRVEPVRSSDGTLLYWIGVNLSVDDPKEAAFSSPQEERVVHMSSPAFNASQKQDADHTTNELEQAYEELKTSQAELQRRWQYLAEAQKLSHSGTFGWKVRSGELTWSDETYRILGFTRATNPTLDLVFDRIHPDDRDHLQQLRDSATQNEMDLDVEHRILMPDGAIKHVHTVAHAGRDNRGDLEYMGVVTDITEHKRADEELQVLSRDLQESKARLEEAQRVAHLGHYYWNLDENHVVWSDELYRIYGLEPVDGPIDMAMVREMIHVDDREHVFRAAEEAVRSGGQTEAEHRVVRPDGEVRTVRGIGSVKRDSSGRVYEMFGAVQDITDRKRAEEALRQSEFYLSEGQRLAHLGSWASKDLGIRWTDDLDIYWSDEVYKIHGLEPQNGPPTIQQYLSAIHPDDRASMAETIRMMHEQRCGCDVTNRIVRPDGEVRYVRCVGVPVFEDGVFRAFHGTTIDVTEHELLTQELRREQAYLLDAQSLAHLGSWVFNLVTQKLLRSSDENARLYGFDPSQGPIPSERFFDSLLPEDEPAVRATLESAVRTGTDFYLPEYRIRHTDGSIKFLRAIGHRNPSGEYGEYVGITLDITEQKHAEEEREKLRQLQADLAHINRVNVMGELSAALAHEIKQPIAASITSANACLRWLAHSPPDLERARNAATRIERHGNRAAAVINRLQSFYRKGTPPEREMLRVEDIVREMVALLKSETVRHSITIHTNIDGNLPDIFGDRVQLQQVFMNLMMNAIDAMRDNGGELTISSRLDREAQVIVSICDTGVGLPLESLEQIFEAFHTTKPQGMGMGLAITRSIMEFHGGRVWATRNEGTGSTFHFTLPVKPEEQS